MYSFETSQDGVQWDRSKRQFNSIKPASLAAAYWMEVNLENKLVVLTRLVRTGVSPYRQEDDMNNG